MVLDDFQTHLAGKEAAPRTVQSYLSHLKTFAAWFAQTNGIELDKTNLTQVDAREYKQSLLQRQASPATVNAHLAAVRAFAAWCDIPILVKSVEQQALAPRWLDRRQQAALLRAAQKEIAGASTDGQRAMATRDHAIVVLLLNTGLRVSELCKLQPADITIGERSGTLIVRQGKGTKQRTVSLNKDARAALANLSLPVGLTAGQIDRRIAALGRAAGEHVTPHVLRHTFAKGLADHVALDRVATLLGHAKIDTTRRYTTPSQQDLQAAVETLEG